MSSKRSAPLAAAPDPETAVWRPADGALEPTAPSPFDGPPPPTGASRDQRDQRFADGVRRLRVGGASMHLDERILLLLAGTVAPLGLVIVLLGWWGAAHTPFVFEQVPYLISGGLLGLGLLFLGSFFYFAHWLTQLVKEHRVQSLAVVEAIQRLQDQLAETTMAAPTGRASAPQVSSAEQLVATERGTMAHRPACVVVAGKGDLRAVTAADGLAPCKMCEPYAADGL